MLLKGEEITIPDVSVHHFFWKKCLEKGSEIILVDNTADGRSLTYKDVYEKSRLCAAFLHKEGLKTGDFVGLCATSCPDYVIAMFGIMGCGATVTPCNPGFKESEILQQFRISEPKAVIVQDSVIETMKKVKESLPCLQKIYVIGESSEFNTLNFMLQTKCDLLCLDDIKINRSEDLVILPHSSGTTGLPKCVMITHRNVMSALESYMKQLQSTMVGNPVGYMDRPLYSACGYGIVFLSLAVEMKLIIDKKFEVETMLKTIEKYKVTHLFTVPPILIQLADTSNFVNYNTASIRTIISGGASMAPEILRRLIEKFNISMIPSYAMTEVCPIALGCNPKTPLNSCGTVGFGIEIKIISPGSAQECDVDEVGEILVRGPQVMKGYLKNPAATASTIEKDGWLHTGDLGRIDKDGLVYVVDRIKEVIKYRSLQVPPAELESVILEHLKVADVGVIGIPNREAGEIPKAFVVKKDDSLKEEDVIDHVKSRLVDYKHLRGGVEFVEKIPKSQTGKILRKELKKMAGIKL